MPRFLISIAILALFSWAGWAWLFFTTPPESSQTIALFLGLLLIALGTTISIPVFFLARRFAPPFTEERPLFRKLLRRCFWLSLLVTGAGALKTLGSLSWINLALSAVFLILLEIYLSRSHS
ncbi:hypothetical protein L6258_01725 [Candidatus Parcubacteria bacterium]|nr:hypothetical protein [Candidatus Parcubacteria bacterium]